MASQLGYMFEISGRSQSLTSEIDFGCAANDCSRFNQPAVTCAEQPDAHCKVNDRMGTPRGTAGRPLAYFGARLAKMRWSVRRCMLRRRAVSETLRPQSS